MKCGGGRVAQTLSHHQLTASPQCVRSEHSVAYSARHLPNTAWLHTRTCARAHTHTHTHTHAHSACITTTTTLTVHTLHGHDAHPQDTWARVQLGPVLMELVKPCSRCQVPTIDQETGERRSRYEPIRTLRTFRGFGENVYVGENAVQLNLGSIAVGDSVDIVERREARRYGKAEDPKE
jgi:hypothetical protein